MSEEMVVVVVSIEVKPEHRAEFVAATLDNARHTRKEPGNLRFDVLQEEEDDDHFLLYETYLTRADVASHQQTAHYLKWREAVKDWMAAPRRRITHHALFFGDHKVIDSGAAVAEIS